MSHVFADDDASVASTAERRDAYYWRFVCTALSFSAFAVGATIVSLTVLPALCLLPRRVCRRVSRAVLGKGMRIYVGMMSGLRGMTYELQGFERLGQPGQLIIANHPTLLDAVFLIAFTPQVVCVAKYAMFRNPLTRIVVWAAGYVSNELTADMVEQAAGVLKSGQCLLMFPEATRSRVGLPLVFQRGAANVGLRAGARITPVYIQCNPVTLTKGEPWYRIPARRPHFRLVVGEDFDITPYQALPSIPVGSRALNEHMRANFQGELQRLGGYTAAMGDGSTGTESPRSV
ncbi:MAG: lysophospholipid acyltransferase family protein [Povalibacter sp.]